MRVSKRSRGNVAILDLAGEIVDNDRSNLDTAVEEAINEGSTGIVLNLGEVPKTDSAGLAIIMACYVRLVKRDIKLVLLNVAESIRYLLFITKLDQIFEEYDNEDEAVEALKEASLSG